MSAAEGTQARIEQLPPMTEVAANPQSGARSLLKMPGSVIRGLDAGTRAAVWNISGDLERAPAT
jgi:hypothetical protein